MSSTPRPAFRTPGVVTSTPGSRIDDMLPGYYMHSTKLGEGGFGKVYLATHIRTNTKVAVKVMNKKKLGVSFFCVLLPLFLFDYNFFF